MVDVQEPRATDGADDRGRPPQPRWKVVVGIAAVVLVVGAAVLWVAGGDDRAMRDALVGRRFVVSSITEDGQPKELVGGSVLGDPCVGSITFREDQLSSTGGCGFTGGGFGVAGGRLTISRERSIAGPLCDHQLMDQDVWLDGVLRDGPAIELVGDRLTLTTDSTTIVLLERAEPPSPPPPTQVVPTEADLSGRTFAATAALIGGIERRIVGPDDEAEPHRLLLRFGDGTFEVTAGCSTGSGTYTTNRGQLLDLDLAAAPGCDPALLDQHEWLRTFLGANPTFGLDGDYLTLGNGRDTIMVSVDESVETPLVQQPEVFGTGWSLDADASVPGFEAATDRPFQASLVLSAGDRQTVYGRDGCNVFEGGVRVEERSATTGTITMDDIATTDAPCPEAIGPVVEAMRSLQTGEWAYVLDGTELRLTAGDRTLVFRET